MSKTRCTRHVCVCVCVLRECCVVCCVVCVCCVCVLCACFVFRCRILLSISNKRPATHLCDDHVKVGGRANQLHGGVVDIHKVELNL